MIHSLQALRFLAFLMIFTWHAHKVAWFDFPAGRGAAMGVSFFVILSGFLTGLRSKGMGYPGLKAHATYVWGKICRFYPIHLAVVIVASLYYMEGVCNVFANGNPEFFYKWLGLLLRNLLLLQSWFHGQNYAFNGVAWFLSTILFLYCIAPLLLWFVTTIARRSISAVILVLCVLCLVNFAYCFELNVHRCDMEFWAYIFPPARIPEFLAGICMGVLMMSTVNKRHTLEPKFSILFTVLEACVFFLWIGNLYVQSPCDKWAYNTSRWIVPNLMLIAVFACQRGEFSLSIPGTIADYIGKLTLPAFLIHQVLIQIVCKFSCSGTLTSVERRITWIYCLVLTLVISGVLVRSKTCVKGTSCFMSKVASLRMKPLRLKVIWGIVAVGLFASLSWLMLGVVPTMREKWIPLQIRFAQEQSSMFGKIKSATVLYAVHKGDFASGKLRRASLSEKTPVAGQRYVTHVPTGMTSFRIDFRLNEKVSKEQLEYPQIEQLLIGNRQINVESMQRPVYRNDVFPCLFMPKFK